MISRPLYQDFPIQITQADKTYPLRAEVDNAVVEIVGIGFSTDQEALMFHRGRIGLQINDQEVMPDTHEAKRLMTSVNTDLNQRYLTFEPPFDAGNQIVSVTYTDVSHSAAPFTPYTVTLYVRSNVK